MSLLLVNRRHNLGKLIADVFNQASRVCRHGSSHADVLFGVVGEVFVKAEQLADLKHTLGVLLLLLVVQLLRVLLHLSLLESHQVGHCY